MRSTFSLAAATAAAVLCAANVAAAPIYGNSASSGNNPLHTIDGTTGVEASRFIGQPSGNGRGIVVVGDVMFYTVTGDSKIYEVNKNTGAPLGFIQTQNQSMSTIAFDGTFFYTADYSGTNKAFKIDPTTGNNVQTITLGMAQQFMDGLEFFNGKLISNRCDACGVYDVYDLSGNVLQAGFITAPSSATGIAFDGTNFLVSNIFSSSIGVYNGSTGALISTINLSSNAGGFLIEDLSVDYSTRIDTNPNNPIPEPETYALMLAGLGMLGYMVRRRKQG